MEEDATDGDVLITVTVRLPGGGDDRPKDADVEISIRFRHDRSAPAPHPPTETAVPAVATPSAPPDPPAAPAVKPKTYTLPGLPGEVLTEEEWLELKDVEAHWTIPDVSRETGVSHHLIRAATKLAPGEAGALKAVNMAQPGRRPQMRIPESEWRRWVKSHPGSRRRT